MRNHTGREETPSTTSDTRHGGVSRRDLLLATGATTAGLAGVGQVGAGAQKTEGETSRFPEVDLRTSERTESNVPTGEREILVHVHGWFGNLRNVEQARALSAALSKHGYDHPVVAATWDATTIRTDRRSTEAAERLADWLRSYADANPETTLRVVGHSLGGVVCLKLLAALDGDLVIDHVALFGAAPSRDAPCTEYASAIENAAGDVYNYHSENDGVVCDWGLGCAGTTCEDPPSNYTDVDVTATVDSHSGFRSADGAVPALVENFGVVPEPTTADGADGTETDNQSDAGPTNDDDSVPGFGILAGIAALWGAARILRARSEG